MNTLLQQTLRSVHVHWICYDITNYFFNYGHVYLDARVSRCWSKLTTFRAVMLTEWSAIACHYCDTVLTGNFKLSCFVSEFVKSLLISSARRVFGSKIQTCRVKTLKSVVITCAACFKTKSLSFVQSVLFMGFVWFSVAFIMETRCVLREAGNRYI